MSCNVLKVNPSEKKKKKKKKKHHTVPRQTRISNSTVSFLGFPVTYSRHYGKCNICAFREEIHTVEDCFWSDCQVLFLLLNGPQVEKKVCSLIDRLVASEGSVTLILPFTSRMGQSVAKTRQKSFYLDLLVQRRHILVFYRHNFSLQT